MLIPPLSNPSMKIIMLRAPYERCLLMTVACSLLLAAGCNSGSALDGETGTVQGKATYKGQPVPAGASVVMIHKAKGYPASGVIGGDGSFTLQMRGEPDILVGEYAVGISPPATAAAGDDMAVTADSSSSAWTAVPVKYQTPETSGVAFTVAVGSNDFQLDLKE